MLTQLITLLGLAPAQDAKGGKPTDPQDTAFADILADLEQDDDSVGVAVQDPEDGAAPQPEEPEAAPAGGDGADDEAELEAWLTSLRKARQTADETGRVPGSDAVPMAQPSHKATGAGHEASAPPLPPQDRPARNPVVRDMPNRLPPVLAEAAGSRATAPGPAGTAAAEQLDLPVFKVSELAPWTATGTEGRSKVASLGNATRGRPLFSARADGALPPIAEDAPRDGPRSTVNVMATEEEIGLNTPVPRESPRMAGLKKPIRISPAAIDQVRSPATPRQIVDDAETPLASLDEMIAAEADPANAAAAPTGRPARMAGQPQIDAMAREMSATIRVLRPASPAAEAAPMASAAPEPVPSGPAEVSEGAEIIPVFRSPRAQRAAQARAEAPLRAEASAGTDGTAAPASTAPRGTQAAIQTGMTLPGAVPQSRADGPWAADQRLQDEAEGDILELSGLTAQGNHRSGSVAGASPLHAAARAEAPHVMRQVADALPRLSEGGIEIRLDPEELGRIRLHMVGGESSMTVHVSADRPETLDLMRRHIDQLARDLADAGYENASFDFGDGQGDGGQQPGHGGSASAGPIEDTPAPQPTLHAVSDGLDILI